MNRKGRTLTRLLSSIILGIFFMGSIAEQILNISINFKQKSQIDR